MLNTILEHHMAKVHTFSHKVFTFIYNIDYYDLLGNNKKGLIKKG